MKLHSLAYTEFEGKTYAWKLDQIEFANINLIVGKNATGKSRILRVFNGLARLIDGSLQAGSVLNGSYKAIFKADETSKESAASLEYSFTIIEQKVQSEKLHVGGVKKLMRSTGGRASIFFDKVNTEIDVQIPELHLAAAVRRDATQHPFFEPLHQWASSVKYFEFSKIEQMTASAFDGKIPFEISQTLPLQNSLHLLIKLGKERFLRAFDSPIISDMHRIGYDITEFGLMPEVGIAIPLAHTTTPQTLYVIEKNIDKKLPQREISNGMLRALATLIYLHFIRLNKKRDCLLIDDIGEGLDFERATKLISIIIEQAEKGFIQLVMTTNDRFIMNGVPLNYWSVIQRDEGKVSVFNQKNSPRAFDEFEQYGFNNFDFFSKKLYSKGLKIEVI